MELSLNHDYETIFLIINTTTSYFSAFIVFLLLSYKFLTWYNVNKSLFLFLFGISFFLLSLSEIIAMVGMDMYLATISPNSINVNTKQSNTFMYNIQNIPPIFAQLIQIYWIVGIPSFVVLWVPIVFMMKYYGKRIGEKKFWISVTIPLLFFLLLIIQLFPGIISSLFSILNETSMKIFFTLNSTLGALLFFLFFLIISKSNVINNTIKTQFKITAFGFLLFFIFDQATLSDTPYPPYGLPSLSLKSLPSGMIFFGIISLALIFAEESNLRKQIRKNLDDELSFLDKIGIAQLHENMEKKIDPIIKKSSNLLQKEIGLEYEYDVDSMKNYINDIMQEKRKT